MAMCAELMFRPLGKIFVGQAKRRTLPSLASTFSTDLSPTQL
jgi:hypothetical protein